VPRKTEVVQRSTAMHDGDWKVLVANWFVRSFVFAIR